MIKNIIFDFGDVFLNLDKLATAREMQKFGFSETTPQLEKLLNTYEKGLVSSEEFIKKAGMLFPKATKEELIMAWNSILLDFPEERLSFIEALSQSKRYRLFLLSNTNELHMTCVKETMGFTRYLRFKDCFEVFYLSFEIKMRKPDSEIFEWVLTQNQLKAEETLFIDDTIENIEAAANLGINTWNLKVGRETVIELQKHL